MNPAFPVYIVSKGRYESRLTVKSLEAMGVPYSIVVEAAEHKNYCRVIDPDRVLVLDPAYQRDYDTFDELGDTKGNGPGPARNFVWDHAAAAGARWHWVMDDNIKSFHRYDRNLKVPVADGTILRCMEDFADRYANVAMAGPAYFMFVARKEKSWSPFVLNTRIYSCNLIRTDVPFRWRGRYNEDTDLSIRMMKAEWATVQFNAFLQYKMPTQIVAGGNTAEFYASEGTLPKSQMLVRMHPDISKLSWRFGRYHHHVDYSPFRRIKLIRKPGVVVPDGPDDYGMRLIQKLGSGEVVELSRPAPVPLDAERHGVARYAKKEPGARPGPSRRSSAKAPITSPS